MRRPGVLVVWVVLVCLSAVLLPGGLSAPEDLRRLGNRVAEEPAEPEDQFIAFRDSRMSLPVRREPVTLVAVGDIMLSRGVADRIRENGDPGLPFAKVKGLLNGKHIVFGNLEGPLTPGRQIDTREMVLRADPGMADALAGAGFTLLSLANNHMGDFGPSGILDTLGYLDEAGISWVGAGPDAGSAYAPIIVDMKGMRIAFLAFTDPEIASPSYQAGEDTPATASISIGAINSVHAAQTGHAAGTSHPENTVDSADTIDAAYTANTAYRVQPAKTHQDDMLAAIRDARCAADFVVVSLHAGTEYADEPDVFQIESARAAIDAGADLVIGHHPHVVQRVEHYRDGYILYSLGNFVFDQWWSRETCQGMIARITIGQKGVERLEFVPVLINRDAQPEVLRGLEASGVLSRLVAEPETDRAQESEASDARSRPELNLNELAIGSLYDADHAAAARYAYLDLTEGETSLYRLVKERYLDLDQDGIMERILLRDGRLTVETASTLVWDTPETWWVDDFALGDANNDGVLDVNISVWKSGSFGPCKPFWVSEDDPRVRNHLFIFKLVDGEMKPVWQSSNLDSPNYELELVDLDGDGQTELLVLEGDYYNPQFRQMSVWKWNDWGFFRVSDHLYRTVIIG